MTDNKLKKVLFDSNILLLLMLTALRRDPSVDTRLSKYEKKDLFILESIILTAEKVVVTPNVLTEVSNQIDGFEEFAWFRSFINDTSEKYVVSSATASADQFPWLGLTDVGLLDDQFLDCIVITDDENLANFLISHERLTIFYSEFRQLPFQ